jgi:hypothetical protein
MGPLLLGCLIVVVILFVLLLCGCEDSQSEGMRVNRLISRRFKSPRWKRITRWRRTSENLYITNNDADLILQRLLNNQWMGIHMNQIVMFNASMDNSLTMTVIEGNSTMSVPLSVIRGNDKLILSWIGGPPGSIIEITLKDGYKMWIGRSRLSPNAGNGIIQQIFRKEGEMREIPRSANPYANPYATPYSTPGPVYYGSTYSSTYGSTYGRGRGRGIPGYARQQRRGGRRGGRHGGNHQRPGPFGGRTHGNQTV